MGYIAFTLQINAMRRVIMPKYKTMKWDVLVKPDAPASLTKVNGQNEVVVQDNGDGRKFINVSGKMDESNRVFFFKYKQQHFRVVCAQSGYMFPYRFNSAADALKFCNKLLEQDLCNSLEPGDAFVDQHPGFGSMSELMGWIEQAVMPELPSAKLLRV